MRTNVESSHTHTHTTHIPNRSVSANSCNYNEMKLCEWQILTRFARIACWHGMPSTTTATTTIAWHFALRRNKKAQQTNSIVCVGFFRVRLIRSCATPLINRSGLLWLSATIKRTMAMCNLNSCAIRPFIDRELVLLSNLTFESATNLVPVAMCASKQAMTAS